MKKLLLLTVIAALPLGLMAQDDDMYFVPTKENVAKETKNYGMPKKTYYSGSNRSVDEYNRSAWSLYVAFTLTALMSRLQTTTSTPSA